MRWICRKDLSCWELFNTSHTPQIHFIFINLCQRKSTSRTKLKAPSQEQIHMWNESFKNLLGNSPKVTDKPITKIIYSQQDTKLGQFIQEFNIVLTKIKSKAAGLNKVPPEVWKTRKFDDLILQILQCCI